MVAQPNPEDQSTGKTPPSQEPAAPAEAAVEPGDVPHEISEEARVRALVLEAGADLDQGRALFLDGNQEEARHYFDQALAKLKDSGFGFSTHPFLEQAYYDLLGEVQNLETQAALDLSQLPVPELPPSPLDEISNLNLFQIEVDPELEERVSEDLKETRFDIPVTLNREVLRFLDYYQGRGRRIMESGLRRAGQYYPLFKQIFEEEETPRDLIYMAHVESLFQPRALSRARAKGIWQFVKGTGKLYDLDVDWWVDERSDVLKSTRAAARHLKDLFAEFEDWNLALAAYNAGAGRIARVLKRYGPMDYWTMADRKLLPRETRNYVPSILAAIIIFRHPERYGFDVEPAPEVEYETVPLDFQIDLRVVAEALEVPVDEIADLNPALLRGVTPDRPDGYDLKVPLGTADVLGPVLESIPPEKRLRLTHHRVAKGQTLSQIARHYGVSVRAIAETNRLRNVNRLSLGQDLIIPLSDWRAAAASLGSSTKATRSSSQRARFHTVRRGDSLYRIARNYGVSVKDLAAWNHLRIGQTIYPGQKLVLSPRGQSARAAGGASSKN